MLHEKNEEMGEKKWLKNGLFKLCNDIRFISDAGIILFKNF